MSAKPEQTDEQIEVDLSGLKAAVDRSCELIDELRLQKYELLSALRLAVGTIKIWHDIDGGEQMWNLYQQSPEMKTINAAIDKAEGKS